MKRIRFAIFLFLIILIGCVPTGQKVGIKIKRLEISMFECPVAALRDSVPAFYREYGDFFRLVTEGVLSIGDSSNPAFTDYLTSFITDYSVFQSYQEVKKQYTDLSDIENRLSSAFGMYTSVFGNEKIPQVYSYISGYNQGIIAVDSIIGIGLDMYLGADYDGYKMLWPDKKYKRNNLFRKKIPSDCMQFWAIARYPYNSSENDVLSNMIYFGKIWYFSKQMMPDEADSLIFGYTGPQVKWCNNNEKQMWTYLVEHKMLYNSDYLIVNKLIGDGPFTQFFTRESPGKASVWLGYRIVESYMKKNSSISLPALMQENDCHKILRMSRYNPD